jgi:hypothetical protein
MTFVDNLNSKELLAQRQNENDNVLTDLNYIMEFTKLVSTFLKQGCDITQMNNGDSIISQTKVIHTNYKWDTRRKKFVKTIQQNNKIDK